MAVVDSRALIRGFLMLLISQSLAHASSPEKPIGIEFSEQMKGSYSVGAQKIPLKFTVKTTIRDFEAWKKDSQHSGNLTGTLTVGGITRNVTGTIDLMAPNPGGGYVIHYSLSTSAEKFPFLVLEGNKYLAGDNSGGLYHDQTNLYGTFRISDANRAGTELHRYSAHLVFHAENPLTLIQFMNSFHVLNSQDDAEALRIKVQFLQFWLGKVLQY